MYLNFIWELKLFQVAFRPDLQELEISYSAQGGRKGISDDWNGFFFTVAVVVGCLIRGMEVIVGTPILSRR